MSNLTKRNSEYVTLTEVWQAYRKAKKEAFYESNCAHGVSFSRFEDKLVENLEEIHALVNDVNHEWARNAAFIGKAATIPKSVDPPTRGPSMHHFCESEPVHEWKRHYDASRPAQVVCRTVIDASVAYLVITTLWVLKVGALFEHRMSPDQVFANRLRRRKAELNESGQVNWDSHSLYQHYVRQYGLWKRKGIEITKRELEEGRTVVALSMDVTSFYDNVDPRFLVSPSYLKRMEVQMDKQSRSFTLALIESMRTWRVAHGKDPNIGLPIGLPSSSMIANLLLAPFDEDFVKGLRPVFYGRYVDDIFVAIPVAQTFDNAEKLLRWVSSHVPGLRFHEDALKLNLPYSRTSRIVFGNDKQRIFRLEGNAGLDVIRPIEEHMRRQASEHRMLPTIPPSESAMAERALLVSREPRSLSVVFRNADFVSLQRAGFAELLSDFEQTAKVLKADDWREHRKAFYGLVRRHMLAPVGFFDFYGYLPRIVGLMAVSGDWEDLDAFVVSLRELKALLVASTNLTSREADDLFNNLAKRIELAVLKALPWAVSPELASAVRALKHVREFGKMEIKGLTEERLWEYGQKLLFADWSRHPFFEWFVDAGKTRTGLPLPTLPLAVRKALHIQGVGECLDEMGLSGLDRRVWRGLVLPTRPMPVNVITKHLGWRKTVGERKRRTGSKRSSIDPWRLYRFVLAMRGVRLPGFAMPKPVFAGRSLVGIRVGGPSRRPIRIAVANFETTDRCWLMSAQGAPSLTLERLGRISEFINRAIIHDPVPDIIVMPELSLPRSLQDQITNRLERSGISLVAGLEYGIPPKQPRLRQNQALVSISLGRSYGNSQTLQDKNQPAWLERSELSRIASAALLRPKVYPDLPIYASDGLIFGVLICSDLSNPRFRTRYQGAIDALICLEWNRDVSSFESLVEATAQDLHCYIVQANNRQFGDSRVRAPFKESHRRDVVQLKGGVHDYFVVAEVDPEPLRDFQSDHAPNLDEKALFKPFPIGFKISALRRRKK